MDTATIAVGAIASLLGALLGTGGLYAYFKLGPERRQIVIETAHEVMEILREDYNRVSDELTQVKMESVVLEKQHAECRKEIGELQASVRFLQRDLDRHGRMAELARRRAHVAVHAIGAYELLIDELLAKMRDSKIAITPIMRPTKIRTALQAEMDKLEDIESTVTEQAVKEAPPPVT